MRYPVTEKLEIIRVVEQSALPVRRTLAHLGIPRATFYRWCEQVRAGGPEALADKPSRPDRVWDRIPNDMRGRIVDLALAEPELSPRELAQQVTRGTLCESRKYGRMRRICAGDLARICRPLPLTVRSFRISSSTRRSVRAGAGDAHDLAPALSF